MGESGSLVQATGSAAFLSPEMGEQHSRNVPLVEKRHKGRERKRQAETIRKVSEEAKVGLVMLWKNLAKKIKIVFRFLCYASE